MPTSLSDATGQTERALLGSVLLQNSLWPQTAELSTEHFSSTVTGRFSAEWLLCSRINSL